MLSNSAKEEARAYLQACCDQGYSEGFSGKAYTGRTFLGYYGWLDGVAARHRKEDSDG